MEKDHEGSAIQINLRRLFSRFRWQILATWFLVISEAGLMVLFPLLMGTAIDGLLQQTFFGLYLLGFVGICTVLVGTSRRFYDTRLYSRIYAETAGQIVEQERERQTDVSIITARTGMATELVEFLENSFPAMINCIVGLGGSLVMIWLLQGKVFVACLVATLIVFAIYAATQKMTYALNRGANDESERTVDVLSNGAALEVSTHFQRIVRWNIRLSDLETINFALSWITMIVVLLFAVVVTIQSGVSAHGKVLSILMYVFGYIESVIAMPLFYQQYVRLQEISHRLVGGR